jgi:ABC-type microcin C transport system permease subunit YejB
MEIVGNSITIESSVVMGTEGVKDTNKSVFYAGSLTVENTLTLPNPLSCTYKVKRELKTSFSSLYIFIRMG